MAVARIAQEEIELIVANVHPDRFPLGAVFDAQCGSLGLELFRCGDETILLSLSTGSGVMQDCLSDEQSYEQARTEARAQLNASSCKPDGFTQWGPSWAVQYRADMAVGAQLLEQVDRGRPLSSGGLSAMSPISRRPFMLRATCS